MALLPNAGPPLPKTHDPLQLAVLLRLAGALRAAAAGAPVTVALVERIASEQGVPTAHAYAALALDPNLAPANEHEVMVAICVGACQGQGAVPVLAALLQTRAERVAAGRPAFDVLPRTCLDMCSHSPVCMSRSKAGVSAHPRLSPEGVRALVVELCGD